MSILAELIAVKHGKMQGRDAAELSMKWNRLPGCKRLKARGSGRARSPAAAEALSSRAVPV